MAPEVEAPARERPPAPEATRRRGDGKVDIQKVLERNFGIDVDEVLPEDVHGVIDDLEDRLEDMENSPGVNAARRSLKRARLLFEMLGAWGRGEHPLPWRSAAAGAAALVYLINPAGILPEFIKGKKSLVDDALFLYLCYRLIKADLKKFAEKRGLDPAEYNL